MSFLAPKTLSISDIFPASSMIWIFAIFLLSFLLFGFNKKTRLPEKSSYIHDILFNEKLTRLQKHVQNDDVDDDANQYLCFWNHFIHILNVIIPHLIKMTRPLHSTRVFALLGLKKVYMFRIFFKFFSITTHEAFAGFLVFIRNKTIISARTPGFIFYCRIFNVHKT